MTPKPDDAKTEPGARASFLHSTLIQAFATTLIDSPRRERMMTGPDSGDQEKLPTLGDLVGSSYRLTRLLGQGAFGKVYAAQRIDVPEHQVALKILPRSLYEGRNVERELVMLATVGHPNVVQLKDHGTGPSFVWLTMPVYQGETLAERLRRGALSLREAYDIFLPIARGLEALHAAGLRHQDIKPENIFLALFGGRLHPVLLDLGVAAEREATFVAGTIAYGAPEQIAAFTGRKDGAPLSEKMDTYALGATILMSLVGPDGFPGMDAAKIGDIAAAHDVRAEAPLAEGALPDLAGAPRKLLIAALRKWLAKDPSARPTMSQLADDLDVLLEKEREEARHEEARRAGQKALMIRLRAAVVAIAGVAVAGAWYGYSKRETLRLASELSAARAEGAASFDKLDTCVASHAIERASVATCREQREKDSAQCRATISAMATSDSSENTKAIQDLERLYAGRLRACEDASGAAQKACSDERSKQAGAWSEERLKLAEERDKALRLADERGASEGALTAQLERCEASRAACEGEQDPYATTSPTPRPPLTSPGDRSTSAGASSPATPAGTSGPVSEPVATSSPGPPITPAKQGEPTSAPTSPPAPPQPGGPPPPPEDGDPYGP